MTRRQRDNWITEPRAEEPIASFRARRERGRFTPTTGPVLTMSPESESPTNTLATSWPTNIEANAAKAVIIAAAIPALSLESANVSCCEHPDLNGCQTWTIETFDWTKRLFTVWTTAPKRVS
jgi:hypothetical protein